MFVSIKTTLAGIAMILGALAGIINDLVAGKPIDFMTYGAAVVAGIGLIWAKDSNVTGGSKPQL